MSLYLKNLPLILTTLLLPLNVFAISFTGGQGYGLVSLLKNANPSFVSYISAGIKLNKYLEFEYKSIDTSVRIPALPFRLVDVKYNKSIDSNGNETYIFYDTDTCGLSITLPISDFIYIKLLYGVGRGKIYEATVNSNTSYSVNLIKFFMQTISFELERPIKVSKSFMFYPKLGYITHFIHDAGIYKKAHSLYLALSVSYTI